MVSLAECELGLVGEEWFLLYEWLGIGAASTSLSSLWTQHNLKQIFLWKPFFGVDFHNIEPICKAN